MSKKYWLLSGIVFLCVAAGVATSQIIFDPYYEVTIRNETGEDIRIDFAGFDHNVNYDVRAKGDLKITIRKGERVVSAWKTGKTVLVVGVVNIDANGDLYIRKPDKTTYSVPLGELEFKPKK